MSNRELINAKIEKAFDSLDLSNHELLEVPEELRALTNLKRLNLSSNNLTHLPDWFQELNSLQTLDLRNCKLENLCNGFEKLSNLTTLYLRANNFTEVPLQLKFMPSLKVVFLSKNNIEKFPAWFFQIQDVKVEYNPIIDPPIEVASRGIDAIKNYFKEREKGTENLNEAKLLIVGESGAGKTTLMNKILNQDYFVNVFEASTKGIEIRSYYFSTENLDNFRINIWDFGGQEIYHATHQFFLTKRSLYILLSDNRAEDTDFNYWLQTIELLSDNSPILIVQNEKQDRKKDLSEKGMREKFKAIKQIFSLNLAMSSHKPKLKNLIQTIKSNIVGLSHIGTELPKVWVDIRNALEEKAKNVPFIREDEYFDICTRLGMPEKERANFLSDYLHDLGVFLHFKDHPVLKRWIILRPEWGTEAVYKVLDDPKVIDQKGYFTKEDLREIWNTSTYRDMHEELISLMQKFELCYQLEGDSKLIAAQLLDRDKPFYEWDKTNCLLVKYQYGFMPKGIITRFIVKMHYYIEDQRTVWREGVLLERQNTKAEVVETYGEKEIRIRVSGKNKKEFLAIILDTFDKIHSTYSNIKVSKLIPCNCEVCISSESPFNFNYMDIRRLVDNNIFEDRCRESLKMIKLLPLIDDAFGNSLVVEKSGVQIYLSYCTTDKDNKLSFGQHLKALEKQSNFSIFDRDNVAAGINEKKELREQIDVADAIVLLISADYIVDDWCSNEMQKSIDRADTGSCLTIPIIISDCSWEFLPISKLKPILFNGKPLFSNNNVAEALVSATYEIKRSLESFISRKSKTSEISTSSDLLNYQNRRENNLLDEYLSETN